MKDFEQFTNDDLHYLRSELLTAGVDSFQVADFITGFLIQRGYGVSTVDARAAAAHIGAHGYGLPCLQEQLQKLAYIM